MLGDRPFSGSLPQAKSRDRKEWLRCVEARADAASA